MLRVGFVALGCMGTASHAHAATADPDALGEGMRLTLPQAVERALKENPALVDARLGRVLDKYDLDQAEDWFVPRLSLGSIRAERYHNAATGEPNWDFAAGPGVDVRLPTGGALGVVSGWTATMDREAGTWREDAGTTVVLSQPLLRGGGFGPGLAPVRLARLAEENNVLRFKSTVMGVVTSVVFAYRALVEAELQVGINERSLERAQETLEVNRLLVESGRMARQDVTQTEANVANRELGVVESQIRLDDARRDLNVLLGLSDAVRIVPADSLVVEPHAINLEHSREMARGNHVSYLLAILGMRRSEIELMLARNRSRWELSLDASKRFVGGGDERGTAFGNLRSFDDGVRVALSLAIPLNDSQARQLRRQRLSAELAMRQAENWLETAVREMDIAVRNAVRAVDTGKRRMELADSALELAEQKLEVEKGKLNLGLSSNFRLAEFQTDLVNAQVGELRAKIGYLNAVTAHDRTVGVLLERWRIDIARVERPPSPETPGDGSQGAASDRQSP